MAKELKGPQIELPLLSAPVGDLSRVSPNSFVWGALFGVIKKGSRSAVTQHRVPMIADYDVRYTGTLLDQNDLDVLLHLIHLGKTKPPGTPITFTMRSFLRDIGREWTGGTRKFLRDSITRMQACAVWITKDGKTYSGQLLGELARDDENEVYSIRLNEQMSRLFDFGWSVLNHERRSAIKGDLAKWLYAFTARLDKPLTFKLNDLATYCGSTVGAERNFRAALKDACAACNSAGHPLVLQFAKGKPGQPGSVVMILAKPDRQLTR